MADTKVLARDLLFEVRVSTGPDVYAEVKGLTSIGLSSATNRADTTDFNDDGDLSHMVASRGLTITLEGFRVEDEGDGSRDAGQARMEVLADLKGTASLGAFRLTSQGGEVWTFAGTVEVNANGGGNDDPAAWTATIEKSGATTKA